MDIRAIVLPERQLHHRRGSLPLKKRITSHSSLAAAGVSPAWHKNESIPSADETLAALALIQAASSGSPATTTASTVPSRLDDHYRYYARVPQTLLPLLPRIEQEHDAKLSLLSLHARSFAHVPPTLKNTDIDLTIDAAAAADEESPSDLSTLGSSSESVAGCSEETTGVCRGSMARNNAPCRRYCPKGQVYCKMHQTQVGGAPRLAEPAEETNTSSAANMHRQDKRFTGLLHQVCCKATTTRGRSCAYVAVEGTSFCNLHSSTTAVSHGVGVQRVSGETSFARRSKAANSKEKQQQWPLSQLQHSNTDKAATLASSKLVPSPLTSAELLTKTPRGRRASKLAETHAESPYFLLSMIPSDQWRGKLVSILAGPMKHQQGIVEKWSNGWVSVHLAGMGLHNRRSIELAIVKQDDDYDNVHGGVDGDVVGATVTVKIGRKKNSGLSKSASAARRDMVSPLPLSDFDSYLRGHGGASKLGGLRTPRVPTEDGSTPCDTPASSGYYDLIPSVTPGSTRSAFAATHPEMTTYGVHDEKLVDTALGNQTAGSSKKRRMQSP
ncbi:hypothetical protein MPSEU_000315200 [Mayamaea pseudoterrestris]|nr:hypothetical protein MPSEU_000315200 [Mayamaea pseudoterrestris]